MKPAIRRGQSLHRKREGKTWTVYRTEPDNTIGPLIRTYHGPLARLRSWWHTRTPHTID